jgi:hypothetical protein
MIGWRFALAMMLWLLAATAAWAVLAKLVRQETRQTNAGQSLVVCIYDAGGRQIERTYPAGNFCPAYVEE